MDNQRFVELAKKAVADYFNNHAGFIEIFKNGGWMQEEDIYVVWLCKTLQNNKALLSTTVSDGMYYEATYNSDKNEMYLDAYKKWDNKCIEIKERQNNGR